MQNHFARSGRFYSVFLFVLMRPFAHPCYRLLFHFSLVFLVLLIDLKSLIFSAQCYGNNIASFTVSRFPYLQVASVPVIDDEKYAICIVFDCSAFPCLSCFVQLCSCQHGAFQSLCQLFALSANSCNFLLSALTAHLATWETFTTYETTNTETK